MTQDLETSHEFYKGNYLYALDRIDAGEAFLPAIHVGCLIFLGRLADAEMIYRKISQGSGQFAIASFFIAVGYTRHSRYAEAKSLFAKTCMSFRNSEDPHARVLSLQGIAFIRYYCGRYRQSMIFAERAAALANSCGFTYGRMLALDAFAHSAISVGEVRLGLSTLNEVARLAVECGNGGLASGAKISLIINEAQYGSRPERSIRKLRTHRKLELNDTYSRAELNLELIRQLTLCGKASLARKLLNETYELVYKNRNRRQAATANLRSAYLLFLDGDFHQALHLLRTAEMNLHKEVDLLYLAQLHGLENKIAKVINSDRSQKTIDLPDRKPSVLQSALASRIASRSHHFRQENSGFKTGQDPLGDLIDRIGASSDTTVLNELVERRLWNLLRQPLSISPGTKMVLLGSIPGTTIIVDRGDIRVEKILSPLHRRLLIAIFEKRTNKEELITGIWGYKYHPLQHDGVLYSAVRKLRAVLGAEWINLTEEGYALNEDVKVILPKPLAPQSLPSARPVLPTVFRRELNLRQNEILDSLESGIRRQWQALDSVNAFHVSTMTATRDLSDLVRRGMVTRLGKGRATYYVVGQSRATLSTHGKTLKG